jgi:hypothetical protein
MNAYALISVVIMQGASLGQFQPVYEYIGQYQNKKQCEVYRKRAVAKELSDRIEYRCLPISKD